MWSSAPVEVGSNGLPGSIRIGNTKQEIAAAIGRKGLLGHRAPSLVSLAAADLARSRIFGSGGPDASTSGVITIAPRASADAVREVCSLAAAGRDRAVSILDAPNVSPNVTSASASIRLGARGPAFTIDAVSGGGHGAWKVASALVESGRCPAVLLVEVLDDEPDPTLDPIAGPVASSRAVAIVVSAVCSAATPFPVTAGLVESVARADPGPSLIGAMWVALGAESEVPA